MSQENRMYYMTEGQRQHYLMLLFSSRERQATDFRKECDDYWAAHPDEWNAIKPADDQPVKL